MSSDGTAHEQADPPATRHAVPGFEHVDDELCRTFQRSVELVGRKWTAAILLAGILGARRFVEYRRRVEGISDRLLAQRLRELEAEDLLERHVTPTTPVLVTYQPSERAIGLMRSLHPLVRWSIDDQGRQPPSEASTAEAAAR